MTTIPILNLQPTTTPRYHFPFSPFPPFSRQSSFSSSPLHTSRITNSQSLSSSPPLFPCPSPSDPTIHATHTTPFNPKERASD